MSNEENKALVSLVYDLFKRKEIDAAYEHFTPECVFHMPQGDMSVEQCKDFDAMFFVAFPDLTLTIEHMVAEGDKVTLRENWKGTHKGEFMGIPPTGNKIEFTSAVLIKIVSGKWVEFWSVVDRLRLMEQLGVIPKQ